MKYDPSKPIKIKCVPKNIDPLLVEQIKNDAIIICKYLNVSVPEINIKLNVFGGVYYGRRSRVHKRISLGIKLGYNRLILLHELLHHKGFAHGKKQKGSLDFNHKLKLDSFSKYYLKEIFGINLFCFVKPRTKFILSEYAINQGVKILNDFPLIFTLPIPLLDNYYNDTKEFLPSSFIEESKAIEVLNQ